MTRPPKKIIGPASVEDNLSRTLDVMNTINRKATMLLDKAEKIADQLTIAEAASAEGSDSGPDLASSEDLEGAMDAPSASEPPQSDPPPVQPRARGTSEHDDLVDEITLLVFQNVMGRIQPLLDALEKVRDSQQPRPPMTEEEHLSQMLADMRQRVERRRGFIPRG